MVQMVFFAIAALLALAVAGYVQKQIPVFTEGGGRVAATRLMLIVTGFGFGLVVAAQAPDRWMQLLLFCIGFGVVHMPAAVILFVKGRRGAGKS